MQYLSVKEVAKRWGFETDTVRRALRDGLIVAVQLRPRGDWRIPLSEVHRIEQQGRLR